MKKILSILCVVLMTSCSQEEIDLENPQVITAGPVLEGGLLSFKDDKSFIKEYNLLTKLKSSNEVNSWIDSKGHSAFLNVSDSTQIKYDEVEQAKIIYSDALKAILNFESKFKINGKILWLNESNLYLLSENDLSKNLKELKSSENSLEVYGRVIGIKDNRATNTSRTILNANRSKGWSYGYSYAGSDKRIDLTLFNETIILNGNLQSTKMFLKCQRLNKNCSFWKCRWNSDNGGVLYIKVGNQVNWNFNNNLNSYNSVYGYLLSDSNNTVLFADGVQPVGPFIPLADNFVTSSAVNVTLINDNTLGNITTWTQILSWY
ncbi:hypothetical protein [Flavobacterium xanthum]|uniref:Uncharacterized protein n=1 Tax=Flavobacterium xanthum TaxID=69322 RepID=A0A1M6XBN8_9FLAO|nr:hypothetical protein [Flavobacterium xanthum]SHL03299.1 hypothetical protein SAMN05443669_1001197 [Flavobacterium xanthum]